jgi:hypothetical protein
MKYIFTLLSVAACPILFNSCDKEIKCEDNGIPVVTANAQVATGETINLAVKGVDNVNMYRWSGPSNFSSKEQRPVIENATPYNAGIYTVDVITNDGCIMRSYTDSIEVTGELPTCYLNENTGDFPIFQYINFYSLRHDWGDHTVMFHASSNLGSFTVSIYPRNDELTPGMYDIVEDYDNFEEGKAVLSLTYSATGVLKAAGGKLTVKKIDGRYALECCEIPFTSDKFTGEIRGSLSLIED